MRKKMILFGAVLALLLTAFSAQAASAQTINGPSPFNASNAGPAAGGHVFSIGGALVFWCTTVDLIRIPVTSPPTFTGTHNGVRAVFRPRYTGCTSSIGGVPFPATMTATCDWTLTPVTFGPATGSATVRLAIGDGVNDTPDADTRCPGASAFKIDMGANCDVLVVEQTLDHGPNGTHAGQNLNATHQATPPAAGPGANLLITANLTGIDGWTTACPAGFPASFSNFTTTGRIYVPGIYVS